MAYQFNRLGVIVTALEAQRLIRSAAQADQIFYTEHAKVRMNERGVSLIMVRKTLQNGSVPTAPVLAEPPNSGWKAKVEYYLAGMNVRIVASVPEGEGDTVVITAIILGEQR